MRRARSNSRKLHSKSEDKLICINLAGLDDLCRNDSESSTNSQASDAEDFEEKDKRDERRDFGKRFSEQRIKQQHYKPENARGRSPRKTFQEKSDTSLPDTHYPNHSEPKRHYQEPIEKPRYSVPKHVHHVHSHRQSNQQPQKYHPSPRQENGTLYEDERSAPQYESLRSSPQYAAQKPTPQYDAQRPTTQYDTQRPTTQYDAQRPTPQYEGSRQAPTTYEPQRPVPKYNETQRTTPAPQFQGQRPATQPHAPCHHPSFHHQPSVPAIPHTPAPRCNQPTTTAPDVVTQCACTPPTPSPNQNSPTMDVFNQQNQGGNNSNPKRHYTVNVTSCAIGLEKLDAQFEKKTSHIEIRCSFILKTAPDRYPDDLENICKTLRAETEKTMQNCPPPNDRNAGSACHQTNVLMNATAATELRKRLGTCPIPAWLKRD